MQSSSVVEGGRSLEASEGRRMALSHWGVEEREAASSESRRAALLFVAGAAVPPVAPEPSPGRRPLGPCRVSRCAFAFATPLGMVFAPEAL